MGLIDPALSFTVRCCCAVGVTYHRPPLRTQIKHLLTRWECRRRLPVGTGLIMSSAATLMEMQGVVGQLNGAVRTG
jgi:hypothetical protein